MSAPRRTLDEIAAHWHERINYVGGAPAGPKCIRAACEEYAAGEVAEAVALVRDLLPYMERHSYSWDGVNGRHPQVVVNEANSFLAAYGGVS